MARDLAAPAIAKPVTAHYVSQINATTAFKKIILSVYT